MAKTSTITTAKICIAMARQPNKKFSTKDFLTVANNVDIRTIQRHLKQLRADGIVVADNCNPMGYKLAVN